MFVRMIKQKQLKLNHQTHLANQLILHQRLRGSEAHKVQQGDSVASVSFFMRSTLSSAKPLVKNDNCV